MKISGEATVHAPVERVWQALRDPAVLARTIPGCEQLESTGPSRYRMTVTAGVASTEGTYSGTVEMRERQRPSSFAISAGGAGAPGTIEGDVHVWLSEVDGATQLRYDVDATLGGLIGGLGQRLLAGVASRSAGEFFAALDDVLTGHAAPVSPAQAPARKGVPSAALVAAAVSFAMGVVWGRRGR